jgi:hypothetical protein
MSVGPYGCAYLPIFFGRARIDYFFHHRLNLLLLSNQLTILLNAQSHIIFAATKGSWW